jgi:hypothetical protein
MARADIHDMVRTILYGSGLGEKPAIRLAAADASEDTSSAPLISFALATGEGAKVKQGNVLSVYEPTDPDDAHVIYVTSISTDTITGVNGGMVGAPAVAINGDLDSVVLEQNALVTSHEIHQAIDVVVDRHLWPDLYNIEDKTITSPDLVDGQEAVGADVQEIMAAWQIIGETVYSIPFQRHPLDVNTAIASTGRMAEFDWIDGGTGYYTAKTKIAVSDDDGGLTRLIATGASAMILGGSIIETTLSRTKKDNIEAVSQRNQVGGSLWRDFLTLKQEYARELGRHNESRLLIDRG